MIMLVLLCSHAGDSLEDIKAMKDVNAAVKSIDLGLNSSSQVFAHSSRYQGSVTLDIVITELLRNILLAMLAVFICTFFLLADIIGSLIVLATVVMTLVDVGGKFLMTN